MEINKADSKRDSFPLQEDGNSADSHLCYTEAELAGAKLARGLVGFEHVHIQIESGSVYGAAMLMPQLARSTEWNCHLASFAIWSYVYPILCIFCSWCIS